MRALPPCEGSILARVKHHTTARITPLRPAPPQQHRTPPAPPLRPQVWLYDILPELAGSSDAGATEGSAQGQRATFQLQAVDKKAVGGCWPGRRAGGHSGVCAQKSSLG